MVVRELLPPPPPSQDFFEIEKKNGYVFIFSVKIWKYAKNNGTIGGGNYL